MAILIQFTHKLLSGLLTLKNKTMDSLKQKVETLNQICVDKFGCTVHQLMDDYHFHGLMEKLNKGE